MPEKIKLDNGQVRTVIQSATGKSDFIKMDNKIWTLNRSQKIVENGRNRPHKYTVVK